MKQLRAGGEFRMVELEVPDPGVVTAGAVNDA